MALRNVNVRRAFNSRSPLRRSLRIHTREGKPGDSMMNNLIARWKLVDVGSVKNHSVLINSQFFWTTKKKTKIIYCSIDACVNQIITVIYFVASTSTLSTNHETDKSTTHFFLRGLRYQSIEQKFH